MQHRPDERQSLIEQVLAAIGQSLAERSEDELQSMLALARQSLDIPYSTFRGPSGQVMVYAHPQAPRDIVVRDLRALAHLLDSLPRSGQPN